MAHPGGTDPRLLSVQAALLQLEPIFHRPAFGTCREDYERRTSPDYWEVGASGRVYHRDFIIASVVERGKVEGDEGWIVSDARCGRLGRDTYALTYRLDQAGRITRRLTIWRRAEATWQVLYHQGTIVSELPDR